MGKTRVPVIRHAVLVALVGVLAAPGWGSGIGLSRAQAPGESSLVFFEPVRGTLNAGTPAQDWTFDGLADQVISILAVTVSGDLDPVIEVTGPDGSTIAQNDDLDSLVTDAGLEALALPVTGTYTVRVGRFGETSGEYELTLTPGFARLARLDTFDSDEAGAIWVQPGSDVTALDGGRLRVRAVPTGGVALAMPSDAKLLRDVYVQVQAQLDGEPSYAELGLIFRVEATPGGLRSYQFRVNTGGEWSVLLEDETGEFVLKSWTRDRALDTSRFTLAVLARSSEFAFYCNGALLGTLSDDRLAAPGRVGMLVAVTRNQADSAAVLFDDLHITTRLGTTYRGLPLALASWDSGDPGAIMEELAASGQVTPGAARDLFVPEVLLGATDRVSKFESITGDRAQYGDFLLGASVSIITTGTSTGCGLLYRWVDERNLGMVFVDEAGGFGLVQAVDADLITNVYALSGMVAEGPNDLLIVAQGERVALYINGALVAQEIVGPGAGRVGVALLNYEDVNTDCTFRDVWVWPLEE
ncbi:MAG: hypothetical protein JXJ20_14205 [Anaerolineae bacterium]|nr:hypothetical protein [Anaerolineae bacterium]